MAYRGGGTPKGVPPLVMRLSFTRFATELGALQPLTTTYNLLTSPYKPLTTFFFWMLFTCPFHFFEIRWHFNWFWGCWLVFIKKRDLGPKKKIFIEGQTSPRDHLRSIERKKLCIYVLWKASATPWASITSRFTLFIELWNAGRLKL